jgi:hypothetical protein
LFAQLKAEGPPLTSGYRRTGKTAEGKKTDRQTRVVRTSREGSLELSCRQLLRFGYSQGTGRNRFPEQTHKRNRISAINAVICGARTQEENHAKGH